MKMNNKGFSLVELIIVIAIMVVLGGVLAPQYMKHLKDAKVAADVANGDAIATAVNVAIASGELTEVIEIKGAGGTEVGGAYVADDGKHIANLKVLPASKVNEANEWKVNYGLTDGVQTITLNGEEIWPDGSNYTGEATSGS